MSREILLAEIEKETGNDPLVCGAFRVVDRAEFVPRTFTGEPYEDKIINVGKTSTMSEPVLMAKMMAYLELRGVEKVLEVGSGLGYGAALLGQCAGEVDSIEFNEDLALIARTNINGLGYGNNVRIHIGDGALGLPNRAPFDAISVTACARFIPEALINQLRTGGRMVIPVGEHWGHADLLLVRKFGEEIEQRVLEPVKFIPLISSAHGGWTIESMKYAKAHEPEIAARRGEESESKLKEALPKMTDASKVSWGSKDPNFELID